MRTIPDQEVEYLRAYHQMRKMIEAYESHRYEEDWPNLRYYCKHCGLEDSYLEECIVDNLSSLIHGGEMSYPETTTKCPGPDAA